MGVLICVASSAAAGTAAPIVRELGLGLTYYRAHELPADLPTTTDAKKGACILDLRFAKGDPAGAAALSAWVKFNAGARAPVLILANSSTEPLLLLPFAGRQNAGVIVIGPAAPGFGPDVALKVAPEEDRKGYDALEKGAKIESLLEDNPGKQRLDEALLEREHLSDSDLQDQAAAAKDTVPATPPPLVDPALQGAVHLHRALVALKRL